MTGAQLLILARLYAAHTETSLREVGRKALAGNHKFFARLEAGGGVNTKSIERAASWFGANWPPGLEWPATVPRPSTLSRPGAGHAPGGEAGAGGSALSTTLGRDCRP